MMNVPYVGCGVLASSLTMDKAMAKVHFLEARLNVSDFVVVSRQEITSNLKKIVAACEGNLSYPMFVKPANMGSSVGVSKAKSRKDLEAALKVAAQYDRKILIEQGINARELEVSVLGNDKLEVSVVGEIEPCNEFYDYEAKYVKGDSKLFIPAKVSKELAKKIQDAAKVAFESCGCEGMARVDFFLERGTDKIYINELNTIPGFTSISMYPKMFAAAGLPYPKLVQRLLDLAVSRHNEQKKNKTV
jgi:D-alanine-D-alanine ligase